MIKRPSVRRHGRAFFFAACDKDVRKSWLQRSSAPCGRSVLCAGSNVGSCCSLGRNEQNRLDVGESPFERLGGTQSEALPSFFQTDLPNLDGEVNTPRLPGSLDAGRD